MSHPSAKAVLPDSQLVHSEDPQEDRGPVTRPLAPVLSTTAVASPERSLTLGGSDAGNLKGASGRAAYWQRNPGSKADFILHRLLAVSDLIAIVVAATFAVLVVLGTGRSVNLEYLVISTSVMIPAWYGIAYAAGLYHASERRIDHSYVDELGTMAIAATAWCWMLMIVRAVIVDGANDLLFPMAIWVFMVPALLFFRSLARRLGRGRRWNIRPIVTIGDPAGVAALTQRIERHSEWGFDVKLMVVVNDEQEFVVTERTDEAPTTDVEEAWAIAGRGEAKEREFARLIADSGVDRAIIAGGSQDLTSRTRLIHELIENGISVDHISGGPETLYSNAVLHDLEGMPVLSVRPTSPRPLARRIKRAMDVVLSALGLIVLSPVLLWAAVRIKLDSKGPVFYRQTRCGLDGEGFELLKLRTMVDGAHDMRSELRRETEGSGNDDVLFKIKDDPRITKFGGLLRRTSLDELPQLWNVLVGDMSMVGPRPLVFEEALQATDIFTARTRMKPGIAGPWQALGRSSIPFEDMIKLDYAYVVGWSMSEDMRLLLRTVTAVAKRNGAL